MTGEMYTDMAIVRKHVKAIIQLRRATEAEWIEVNPILRVGEPALSMDVYKLKIGKKIDNQIILNEMINQFKVEEKRDPTEEEIKEIKKFVENR